MGPQSPHSFADLIERYRFPEGYRSLFLAAVAAFAEQGFHATTTRQIAARAGLSSTALYAHFASKEALLHRIAVSALEIAGDLVTEEAAHEETATEKLRAVVGTLSAWHAHHQPVARVVLHQLDALTPEHLAEVVKRRHVVDRLIRRIIADGVAAGEFDVADRRAAAVTVLSLCLDVARWYQPRGPRGPEQIGEHNAGMALRLVGAHEPVPSPLPGDRDQARITAAVLAHARADGASLLGREGVLTRVNQAVLQAALNEELHRHLAHNPADSSNGSSPKTVRTEFGEVHLQVPRDREGSFDPQTVPRLSRNLAGFDELVLSLYGKGLSTGAIREHLAQVYDIEVSRSLISRLTGGAAGYATGQDRPRPGGHPIIRIGSVRAKIRGSATPCMHVAVGISLAGRRDPLGVWHGVADEEFWLRALTELKAGGAERVLVVCGQGQEGLARAARATWPRSAAYPGAADLLRDLLDEPSEAEFGAVLQRAIDRHGVFPDRKAAEKALILAAGRA
jgi:AcrR family transcriptional regulator